MIIPRRRNALKTSGLAIEVRAIAFCGEGPRSLGIGGEADSPRAVAVVEASHFHRAMFMPELGRQYHVQERIPLRRRLKRDLKQAPLGNLKRRRHLGLKRSERRQPRSTGQQCLSSCHEPIKNNGISGQGWRTWAEPGL